MLVTLEVSYAPIDASTYVAARGATSGEDS